MKIIEGLKKVKDLQRKLDDLKDKISKHSADMDFENPIYPDQKAQIASWVQACSDIVREIERLKNVIHRTNLTTPVTITIGKNSITKSISEWIERRKTGIQLELNIWKSLTNRNLKDMHITTSTGNPQLARVRYYYDVQKKDEMIELLTSEPSLIDSKLEIVNALTDLLE